MPAQDFKVMPVYIIKGGKPVAVDIEYGTHCTIGDEGYHDL